jgi:Protein of unknown function (DUF2752)
VTADLLTPPRAASLRIVGPPRLAPAAVAQRYAAVGAVTIGLGALHLRHRPTTLCLFRELTGIPCPFCGGTTAAVRLGHGNLGGALAASPLAVAMVATWPLLGRIRAPAWWQRRRHRWLVIGSILVAAEVWQLARFGLLHL